MNYWAESLWACSPYASWDLFNMQKVELTIETDLDTDLSNEGHEVED